MHTWVRYCLRPQRDFAYVHLFSGLWKAVITHSSTTVPLPYTLSGATPLGRLLTWLPRTAPAFYFDSLVKSKGGLPCPLRPFLLSIVDRQENTSPRLWLNPTVLGQNAGRQIVVKRKDGLSLFFSFPLFPLFPPSWLISGVKRTVGDSLEEVEVQPERCTWMKVTVQYVRADVVNGQRADSLSAVQKKTHRCVAPFQLSTSFL